MDVGDECENDDHEKFTCTNDSNKATLKDPYNATLSLRNTLNGCKALWYEHWPPLASDINGENVRKLVSQKNQTSQCTLKWKKITLLKSFPFVKT